MTDTLTLERRSWNMSRIRGRDTTPEKIVRSALHRMGYRFRLHRKDLPGSPDIVLPKHRTVIFVHGCFWHHHEGCGHAYVPKTRRAWWEAKFAATRERDARARSALEGLGWRVVVVWECEILGAARSGPRGLTVLINRWLGRRRHRPKHRRRTS